MKDNITWAHVLPRCEVACQSFPALPPHMHLHLAPCTLHAAYLIQQDSKGRGCIVPHTTSLMSRATADCGFIPGTPRYQHTPTPACPAQAFTSEVQTSTPRTVAFPRPTLSRCSGAQRAVCSRNEGCVYASVPTSREVPHSTTMLRRDG